MYMCLCVPAFFIEVDVVQLFQTLFIMHEPGIVIIFECVGLATSSRATLREEAGTASNE